MALNGCHFKCIMVFNARYFKNTMVLSLCRSKSVISYYCYYLILLFFLLIPEVKRMDFTSVLPPPWSLLPNESAPLAPPPDTAPPTRCSSPPRSTRLRPLCSTTHWMTSAHLTCTESRTGSWSSGSWRSGRGSQVTTHGSTPLTFIYTH